MDLNVPRKICTWSTVGTVRNVHLGLQVIKWNRNRIVGVSRFMPGDSGLKLGIFLTIFGRIDNRSFQDDLRVNPIRWPDTHSGEINYLTKRYGLFGQVAAKGRRLYPTVEENLRSSNCATGNDESLSTSMLAFDAL